MTPGTGGAAFGPPSRDGARTLPRDQRLAGIAALGIVGSLFLPWWRDPLTGLSYWAVNRFTFIELALCWSAGSVLLLLYGRAEGRGFHLPLADGTLAAGAGIWCCVLVLARIIDPPTRVLADRTLDYDLRWGFLVAFAAGVLLAVAGVRGRRRLSPRPERGAGRRRRRGNRPRLGRVAESAMKALVTGATGKVGHAVAQALVAARRRGARPRARPGERGDACCPPVSSRYAATSPTRASVAAAVEGCELVFNAMGLPEQWLADESRVRPRERRGHAHGRARGARGRRARRLVHTSTRTSSTRSRASASTRRRSPTTRRARRTSARSSAPSSSRSRSATASRS